MDDFVATVSLFRYAVAGIILVSFICSYLGVYIVLKRIIFVGVAIAQISSLGVAFALMLGLPPMIFSVLFTLLGMFGMSTNPGGKKLSREAIIGLGFITAYAATILLMAKSALGVHEIEHIVYGDILAISPQQVYIALGAVIIIIVLHILFYKEFVFVSFDYDMARALGVKAQLWNILLYLTIGAAIAIGIMIAGNMMIIAAIILPPINGLILSRRLKTAFIISSIQGVSTATVAFFVSYLLDLPYGPTAAGCSFIVLGFSFIVFKFRR